MRVLTISAHPDDETLGAGGTLLGHADGQDSLSWLIITKAHATGWASDTIAAKEAEVEAVARAYRMERVLWPGLPAARLDTVPLADIMDVVLQAILDVRPELVYVVHGGDVHSDHRIVAAAVNSVIKPFAMSSLGVRRLLAYECLSSTDAIPPEAARAFLPTVWRNITPYIERKLEVMNLYASELQPEHFPRTACTLRALARVRGATVGVEYAEVFALIREIV